LAARSREERRGMGGRDVWAEDTRMFNIFLENIGLIDAIKWKEYE
jgi:hypothetical protein